MTKKIGLIGIVILIVSEGAVLYSYDFSSLTFCWTSQCITNARDIFSLPIEIAYVELTALAFIVALAKLHTAERSLRQQTQSARLANSLGHLKYFQELVETKINSLGTLRDSSVSIPMLHAVFFPHTALLFHQSNPFLNRWSNYVDEQSARIDSEGMSGFNRVQHRRTIEPWMQKSGIYVGDIEYDEFLRLERDCYHLFNFIYDIGGAEKFCDHPSYIPALV